MADIHIWTAAELERLTPEERQRLLNERVVTDLSEVPPEFLAKVRAKGAPCWSERGLVSRQGDGG